jgi:hypothetical protein
LGLSVVDAAACCAIAVSAASIASVASTKPDVSHNVIDNPKVAATNVNYTSGFRLVGGLFGQGCPKENLGTGRLVGFMYILLVLPTVLLSMLILEGFYGDLIVWCGLP